MADPQVRTFPNGQQAVMDAEGDWVPYKAPGPSLGETAATDFGAPALGAILGGKTPAGPVGSAIGAAAGAGYGDVYKMLAHGLPPGGSPPTLKESSAPGERGPWSARLRGFGEGVANEGMDNLTHMGEVGLGTLAGETVIPPVMNAVGGLRKFLPSGSGTLAGGALGYLTGHTVGGTAAGAALDAAPAVGSAVRALGTPAESGPLSQVPDYLKTGNWGDTLQKTVNWVGQTAEDAYTGLKNFASRFGVEPEVPVGSPDTVKGAVDYAGGRATDLNAAGTPWKDAMRKASGEAGWPLGQSSASTVKLPADMPWPPSTPDEVLANMPRPGGAAPPAKPFRP